MKHRPVPVLAALSGLASVVFLFVGQGLSGASAPDFTKSRAAHAAWLATHHASTKGYAGDTIELLGILLTIVFAATLWIVLRDGDDTGIVSGTAFGAGIASAAVKLASVPAAFAIYWRADQGFDPQLATALFDMNDAAFVLTWAIDAVMLGAAALIIFRAGVLPRWLGWLGAIAATISFISVPFAAKVPPLGMLLTFVWVITVSIVLTRRAVRRDARVAVATA
jgi:Domain of unknown function (DUF4386)